MIFSRYFFTFALMVINFCFYPFALTSFMEIIEILEAWPASRYSETSYIFACAVFTVLILFLITLWSIPIYHYKRKNHPLFQYRFMMFFWAFKPSLSA